jgi:hypothetical protein
VEEKNTLFYVWFRWRRIKYKIKTIKGNKRIEESMYICWIWGSHSGSYECCHLQGYSTVWSVCEPSFRRNASPPSSKTNKKNSMVWVRERTIPTDRPPLVGDVIANFCG